MSDAKTDGGAISIEDWSNPKWVYRRLDMLKGTYRQASAAPMCLRDLRQFGGFARLLNNYYSAIASGEEEFMSVRALARIADTFHRQLPRVDVWGPDHISSEAFCEVIDLAYDAHMCWMLRELLKGVPQGSALELSQENVAKAMQSEIRDVREIIILGMGAGKIAPKTRRSSGLTR